MCPCCGEAKVHEDLIYAMDELRERYGLPLPIASGYRCAAHNLKVGGSPKSYHVRGLACDPSLRLLTRRQRQDLFKLVLTEFRDVFGGIGIGETKLHLDIRPGLRCFWTYT